MGGHICKAVWSLRSRSWARDQHVCGVLYIQVAGATLEFCFNGHVVGFGHTHRHKLWKRYWHAVSFENHYSMLLQEKIKVRFGPWPSWLLLTALFHGHSDNGGTETTEGGRDHDQVFGELPWTVLSLEWDPSSSTDSRVQLWLCPLLVSTAPHSLQLGALSLSVEFILSYSSEKLIWTLFGRCPP